MSECACGGTTRKYVQDYGKSVRTPFERCIRCGFTWGVKR